MATAEAREGLVLHHLSVHGLIRAHDLELGRDADTGGQTKYVVELARALGKHPAVREAVLFTRLVDDERVDEHYARQEEPIGEGARIVRIRAGGGRYRRKETLWPYLEAFVDGVLQHYRTSGELPDVIHGHYADAGLVAERVAALLRLPLIVTGHSLGRNKVEVLRRAGVENDAIESRYRISHRIQVEERLLTRADRVIASTEHEVEHGYERYEAHQQARFEVIPPGVDLKRFYPWFYDSDGGYDPGEEVVEARVRMKRELDRFLTDPDKPLILAISRPDKRKNIVGLITAYGEDPELRRIANLAIFAGVRKDIEAMSENEREVLTELLLTMDRYDLYGRLALPKKHDPDTDIPVLYRLAAASGGVFVNPALVENFGITLIEASASGLPVVSTDHGGPQTIIERCGSGELIDARDTDAIRHALKRILVDEDLWDRYSRAGIEGVREHYAWNAHVERYLKVLDPLLPQGDASEASAEALPGDWRTAAGRRLLQAERLLVCDIDGTLIGEGADDDALRELADALEEHGIAFGLASGRSLALTEDAIRDHDLPSPDLIVHDVGSGIVYGPERIPDEGFAARITSAWDRDAVDAVAREAGAEAQDDSAQTPYKASYLVPSGKEGQQLVERIRKTLQEQELRVTVIASHDRYLDLLPERAGKDAAVRYIARRFGFAPSRVAVAGDSGNDRTMLNAGFRAIVVGNFGRELQDLHGRKGIRFAEATHARGVLEGLRAHRFL